MKHPIKFNVKINIWRMHYARFYILELLSQSEPDFKEATEDYMSFSMFWLHSETWQILYNDFLKIDQF